jgi:hypothetical protein
VCFNFRKLKEICWGLNAGRVLDAGRKRVETKKKRLETVGWRDKVFLHWRSLSPRSFPCPNLSFKLKAAYFSGTL